MLENKRWHTGSNKLISLDEIKTIITELVKDDYKIYIGSDSFITQGNVNFASTICLHKTSKGGRYFFYKEKLKSAHFVNLVSRITEETRRSVEIAEFLLEETNSTADRIELHLDVSPFSANQATSKFSEMLKGYVIGFGLDCKLKPNAWASQSVADKHSK